MSSTTSSPIRLALLGAGTFASSAHYSIISKLQEANKVSVHLVWSRSAKSATSLAQKYGSHVISKSAETSSVSNGDATSSATDNPSMELLSAVSMLREHRSDIDVVILCVPIPQNAMFTRSVLSLGLHVFCEKPLAHDIPSATKLLLSIKNNEYESNVMYAVGENFRFEHVFQRARSAILSDDNNELMAITLTAQTPMPSGSRYAFGWRLNQLSGAGILKDGFVHTVAGLRVLTNSNISTVSAKCSTHASHFEKGCDTAAANFFFENGIPATVFVSYATAVFEWRLVAVGSKRDVIIERVQGQPGYNLTVRDANGVKSEEFMPFCGIDREFDAFIESCRSGMLDERLSATEAFNDIAPVDAMFESSQLGQIVNVPKAP